jgi:[ribosomal protein S18]-alanine N-acetyltransferase
MDQGNARAATRARTSCLIAIWPDDSPPSSGQLSNIPSFTIDNVSFVLRDYKPEDFDRLHAIDQECFPPEIAYTRRELSYYMKLRAAFTIVAEDNKGRIAGFIVAQKHQRGMGHIVTIDTVAAHRRSGLGTLLMSEAENRLRAAGCDAMFLETAVDNKPAITFYERLGYVIVKDLPGYYPNGLDGFLMVKRFEKKQTSQR